LIYLLTAVGLSPSSSTHLHTNNTYNNTKNNRTTQIKTNVKECGPCPFFASFNLTFALQMRKKQGKISVRVRKTSVGLRKTSEYSKYGKNVPIRAHRLKCLSFSHLLYSFSVEYNKKKGFFLFVVSEL
jgi:hypothetical protein